MPAYSEFLVSRSSPSQISGLCQPRLVRQTTLNAVTRLVRLTFTSRIATEFKTYSTVTFGTYSTTLPPTSYFLARSPPFWRRFCCPIPSFQRIPRTIVLDPTINQVPTGIFLLVHVPKRPRLLTDRFSTPNGTAFSCDARECTDCSGLWNGIANHPRCIQSAGFDTLWVSPVCQSRARDFPERSLSQVSTPFLSCATCWVYSGRLD